MFHHGDASVGIAGQSYELAGETTFSDVEHYNEFVSRLSNTMALVSDFPFEIVPVGMREDTYCVASEFSSDNGWLSDSKEVRYPVYRYEQVDTWRGHPGAGRETSPWWASAVAESSLTTVGDLQGQPQSTP